MKDFLPTRRSFLALSSSAAVAGALPKSLLAQAGGDVFSNQNLGAYTQQILTQKNFEKLVGDVFHLFYSDGRTAKLTLVSVTPTGAASASSTETASTRAAKKAAQKSITTGFQLSFSTGGKMVPQDTYRLDHGRLGSFAVFLVPGDLTIGGTCTACFNYA